MAICIKSLGITVLFRWGLQGTSQGRRQIGSLLDIQEQLLGTKVKLKVEDERKRKYKPKNDIFSRLVFPT